MGDIDRGCEIETPSGLVPFRFVTLGPARLEADPAQKSGEADVAPLAAVPYRRGQVRDFFIRLDIVRDILVEQADATRIDVVAGMLERDRRRESLPVVERPADLRIPQP